MRKSRANSHDRSVSNTYIKWEFGWYYQIYFETNDVYI